MDGLESWEDSGAVAKAAGKAIGLDDIPTKGTDPSEVSAWWKKLSPEERAEYLALHPDVIGNLDGIPAKTRDSANRTYLDQLITIDQRYASTKPLPETEAQAYEGYLAIRSRLDKDSGKEPEPLLLGLSREGQGRAVLSYGDPDTADNVSAYVPGTNCRLSNIGGGDGTRAKAIWEASRKADPGRSTASIVWLGYDAPQAEPSLFPDFSVAGEERGKKGAEDFNNFLNGIRASHEGGRPHITAIGHSYGSFTVGQAAQSEESAADDVVLVGSPGTGAQKADQLSVGSDHVWIGSAENDPITHLPSKYEPVGVALDPHELWFGQDPASEGFGGQRFSVAPGTLDDSHFNYFDKEKGGDSLSNIGKIVTGHGVDVTREGRR
ncbi:alpha/beta hydrolase [Streptomyces sp. NPDC018019]|uniref:alpha/beta hydrolase n=1 Tax=Streptomyces sp. NPDC018019 TaxID=3365030 RepID=UPI0037BC8097